MLMAPLRAALTALPALAIGAVPAIATAKDKRVAMPAGVPKNPDARICMPRPTSQTVGRDKTQPATLCQTAAARAGHDVTIVAK